MDARCAAAHVYAHRRRAGLVCLAATVSALASQPVRPLVGGDHGGRGVSVRMEISAKEIQRETSSLVQAAGEPL